MKNFAPFCVFLTFVFTQKTAQAARKCGVNTCSDEEDPICGSDGRTYRNGCMLTWTACKRKTTILMVHAGKCDPCTNHRCTTPPNSRCKAVNGVATCVCSYKCLRSIRKVCGSNGKTYANECEMQRHSCSLNATVTVIKRGECGIKGSSTGCATKSCPRTTVCRLVAGRARCIRRRRCRRICHRIYRPVCGTNGRTYSNQCVLERLACRYHKDIVKSYDGRCIAVHRRCIGKICPRGEVCKMIRRRPKCTRACPRACPRTYRPVCGTDGNTYLNECSLRLEACRRRAVIKVSSSGKCGTSTEECSYHECKPPLICKVISGRATCVQKVCRSSCPRLYRPVCGTDKKTYPNECEMQRTACRRNENTEIDHEGRCEVVVSSSCKFKTCVFKPYSHCEVINQIPKCVCQTKCPNIPRPVCGTDKRTYKSACLLQLEACNSTTRINIAHGGPCKVDTCETKNCSSLPYSVCKLIKNKPTCVCQLRCVRIYKPVCGSDNKTYPNQCMMKYSSCRQKTLITVRKKGRCQPRKTCASKSCNFYARCFERRSGAVCVCPSRRSCLKIKNKYSPVCASNGLTYINNCTMKIMSCENKKKVEVVSLDECPGTCKLGSICVSPPYSRCSSRTGVFICVCPKFCPKKYDPVCGSDGRLYGNLCTLKISACKTDQTITPANFSECALNHTCANVYCRKQLVCKDIDGKPRCVSRRCISSCPLISQPVCGSDGKTYGNECVLRRSECMKNSGITKAKDGPCKTKPKDQCQIGSPCSSPPNAICSYVTGVLSCVCPRFCTLEYNPVCGSDDRTYGNPCQMRVAACTQNKTITSTDFSKCGECQLGTNCSSPPKSICRNVGGKASCVCRTFCSKILSPVCGSDGKTYDNLCLLEKAACEQNKTINETDLSNCDQCQIGSPCSSPPNAICSNVTGIPSCVCPRFCTLEYNPVCGADGRTYGNPCQMRVAACTQNKTITSTDFSKCGECQLGTKCSSPPKSICRNVGGKASCVCRTFCSKILSPVCGSDGKTYDNLCLLEKAACEQNKTINETDLSNCDQCQIGSPCSSPPNAICSYVTGIPSCVCPRFCTLEYNPVCGSDDKTYGNPCQMRVAACTQNKTITSTDFSKCGECQLGTKCSSPPKSICRNVGGKASCVCRTFCSKILSPVCGSDGKTYDNLCLLEKAACEQNKTINETDLSNCGTCKLGTACSWPPHSICRHTSLGDGKPSCVCPMFCPLILWPVCGSDGKMYSNSCVMRIAACTKKETIIEVDSSQCGGKNQP